ncbi:MAG: glycosyltransferase family 2 protein [Planctomycetota bacterium]|nr:glycosyltransferase family 2 protein [Planctomycetota bacterium]
MPPPRSRHDTQAGPPAESNLRARPDLSVVIVSYNVRDYLERCLATIFSVPHRHEIEVFVVDNASSDGSSEMVRTKYPRARLIANVANRGFAAANNQAIRQSTGRHVLLLNPDTEVREDALDAMIDFMDSRSTAERVGIVGVKITYADGSVHVSCCPFPSVPSTLSRLFYAAKIFPQSPTFAAHRFAVCDWEAATWTDWVTGACLLIRRETIDEIGLMDEGYFLYYEETDWCRRARRSGWRVLYWPGASVVHHGGQSVAQHAPLSLEHSIAGLLRYYCKHHRAFDVVVVHLALIVALLVRATRLPSVIPRLFGRRWPARSPLSRQLSVALRSIAHYVDTLL